VTRSRFLAVLAAVSLSAAAVGGLWPSGPPPAVHATHMVVSLRVNPGADGWFNCSWHSECGVSAGHALDWSPFANHSVYWRSHGYRSDTSYSFTIATGTIEKQVGGCQTIWLKVRDAYDFDKGYVSYVHTGTWTNGWTIDIRGSSGWTYESYAIAFTVTSETCAAWDGEHLHQGGSSHFTSTKNSLYDSGVGTFFFVGLLQNWQYSQSWNW
jgi:hypothetical protein